MRLGEIWNAKHFWQICTEIPNNSFVTKQDFCPYVSFLGSVQPTTCTDMVFIVKTILRPCTRGGPKINLCYWNFVILNLIICANIWTQFLEFAIFVTMHPPPQNPLLLSIALSLHSEKKNTDLEYMNILIRLQSLYILC